MKYADHINKELESDQDSHSLLLKSMEEKHYDYASVLELTSEKIFALDQKYEGNPFRRLEIDGMKIDLTVEYLPVAIATRVGSSSDWQLLVTAKCPKNAELNQVGIGRILKKCSHLHPDLHKKVMQELERDFDGISIELQTPPTCFQAAFPTKNPAQFTFNF